MATQYVVVLRRGQPQERNVVVSAADAEEAVENAIEGVGVTDGGSWYPLSKVTPEVFSVEQVVFEDERWTHIL